MRDAVLQNIALDFMYGANASLGASSVQTMISALLREARGSRILPNGSSESVRSFLLTNTMSISRCIFLC